MGKFFVFGIIIKQNFLMGSYKAAMYNWMNMICHWISVGDILQNLKFLIEKEWMYGAVVELPEYLKVIKNN